MPQIHTVSFELCLVACTSCVYMSPALLPGVVPRSKGYGRDVSPQTHREDIAGNATITLTAHPYVLRTMWSNLRSPRPLSHLIGLAAH